MLGSIVNRGSGTWAIVLYLGKTSAGKKRQRWVTVKGSREDAARERARLVAKHYAGTLPTAPGRLTVAQYLTRWLTEGARPRVTPKTLETYTTIVSRLIDLLGARPLAKLEPLDVQGAYATLRDRGLSETTLCAYHSVLRRALNQAVKWDLIERNVTTRVEAPKKARREIAPPSEAELRQLVESLRGSRLTMPTFVAIATGLRRGELLALRWQDVDVDRATLAVRQSLEETKGGLRFKAPKSGKARVVVLPAAAVAALRRYKAHQDAERAAAGEAWTDRDLVFPTTNGRPWHPDQFSTKFTNAVRAAKLRPFRFHDLRHAHATALLAACLHPKIVAERLGHATTAITLEVYSHVTPTMQAAAADAAEAVLRAVQTAVPTIAAVGQGPETPPATTATDMAAAPPAGR